MKTNRPSRGIEWTDGGDNPSYFKISWIIVLPAWACDRLNTKEHHAQGYLAGAASPEYPFQRTLGKSHIHLIAVRAGQFDRPNVGLQEII